jgi:hypothetical protein
MVACRASPDKNEAPKGMESVAEAGAADVVSGVGAGGDGAGAGSGCTGCAAVGVTVVAGAVLEVAAAEDAAALGFGSMFDRC